MISPLRLLPLALSAGLALACSSETNPAPDATVQLDAAPASDAGVASDAEPIPDAEPVSDAAPAPDAEPAPDAGAGPALAVLDARCRYFERVGLITVMDWGGGQRYLDLQLYDRATPWWGPPTSSDAACEFHRAWQGACSCSGTQVCDHLGACVDAPSAMPSVTVVVTGAGGTQTFTGDGAGTTGGEITFADAEIALALVAGGLRVETPSMRIPADLVDLQGSLTGDYDDPQAVDLSWTAPAESAHVYSHTNINHHVSEPTFTTCVVPASAGSLHIDGAMLQPLAVSTGLEFQAIEHLRFAAAETPAGCVEIRFSRPQFVNLQ